MINIKGAISAVLLYIKEDKNGDKNNRAQQNR